MAEALRGGEFDLGNGWKLVYITTPGYEGWCNLVEIDLNALSRPAMLAPECADMVRKMGEAVLKKA